MSLFGFGDISFDKSPSGARGPLAPLVRSEFESNTYRYPLDLGNYDKAHYMVFYVREQKNSSYAQNAGLDDSIIDQAGGEALSTTGVNNPAAKLGSDLLNSYNNIAGRINTATNGYLSGVTGTIGGALNSVVSGVNNVFAQKANILGGTNAATQSIIDTRVKKITGGSITNLLRDTKLTTDAIALYMPDTLMYSHSQNYAPLNLGGEVLGQIAAAAKSFIDSPEGQGFDAIKKSAVRAALAAAETGNQTATAGITAFTGTVVNPMLEMVYRSPDFRTFQFDFKFFPRDEKEAREVQRIIERFKFHQAPEIAEVTQGFLIAPSEFDIRFYYAGKQNPNIPSVATCVLTNIDVNYAPNGFSAFEVPNENFPAVGRTGMPVAIELSLRFQETTFLTKADFKNSRVSDSSTAMSAAYQSAGQVNDRGEGIY